jgi:hypothetical protein
MSSPLARRANAATNPLHSLVYFAPETEQRLTALGLKGGEVSGMSYFAGRSAPMGAVGAGVVTATFYNFSPALVARCIPEAWQLVTPQAVIGERFEAAGEALRRLLGPELAASAEVGRLAGLAREAASGCRPEGRPLYAGHADLAWPGEPLLDMWHAITLLREHRGDGHVAALLAAGLSGIEALVTHTATGRGFVPEFALASRGWTEQEWAQATAGLAARGLLDEDGGLTAAGRDLRAHVEEETDRMAAPPWRHLGDEATEEVIRIGQAMTRTALAAGAFPATGVFATAR